jgi:alkylated DNA repair dioxygenase AlkB
MNILVAATAIAAAEAVTDTDDVTVEDNLDIDDDIDESYNASKMISRLATGPKDGDMYIDSNHHAISSSTKTASATNTYWNIRVNVVCYRDGRDHIGLHADNDQGENMIFTIIAQSSYTRCIIIQNNNRNVRYELFLRTGDGYCMDRTMQKYFLHS